MSTVAVVQARMGSTRLPGKVLADIEGRPMLWRVVSRAARARLVDKVVVATSTDASDDPVAAFCLDEGIACHRGPLHDVLARFHGAAQTHAAHTVVRITADCPLLDPDVLDAVVALFRDTGCDYASNVERPSYPDGLDVEVMSAKALERAFTSADKPSEREHVTPWLRTRPDVARASLTHPQDLSGLRFTVDDARDLAFVREVYRRMAPGEAFGLADILELLRRSPDIATINEGTMSNEGYYRSLYQQAPVGAAPALRLEQSALLTERSRRVIPGMAQTFSKGTSQYVQGASPTFLARGKGCRVWDVDGNEYVDFVQGLLPNILGYAHDGVNQAVAKAMADGVSFTLPHPLEVELAERLTRLIPCAEMVRFGKNGSDATAGAVRAARAFTGRELVACCGYHGWQDWYIGTTTRNAGVPQAVRELTKPFPYNDLPALERLLEEHPGRFAAVIMEAFNFTEPAPGFLEGVKKLARKHGALLIFDEICTGFHFGLGGAQKLFGVIPDLACFGKAMGNGFPISCVVGRADVMRMYEECFFSFTFGGETASLAASMAVLDVLEHTDALDSIRANGQILQDGVNALAREAGLESRIRCTGRPNWSLLGFLDENGGGDMLLRSLFQQEMARRGVLILVTHNMSVSHDHATVSRALEAYASTFKTLAQWVSDADPAKHLAGPMIQPVFRVR
ncbi:3-aminobutyryl-CoA aminotransferase [Fundidesulfovibrio magnetotacticus]|uniref:3-aminobutyryl-CoA aminotransferase n=1 Tax=Fundidesulfovibrio magnetotacticus TaxID=2730080 RepID=A0A6V8LV76_9BACT|nr:aminotransferase class III-fold pyridoxal phosphate-dependent enzyme [Fundidesulfovibrio magnetotacticus]GFK94860.1 3-aminobutyryl-CoA aminotransferase [Fundidesulfovibrio magnetotacticus]